MEQAILHSFSATAANKASSSTHGTPPAAIASPALQGLLSHWMECRGERPMPARDDLAEDMLAEALGELILFELSCVSCAKDEVAPAPLGGFVQGMTTPYHDVMRSGEPIYGHHGAPNGEERLMLPLSRDGRRVDTILVGVQRKR